MDAEAKAVGPNRSSTRGPTMHASGASADALVRRVHALALACAAVLYATSPWIAMLRRVPRTPTAVDWAHIGAGGLAVVAGLGLVVIAFRAGRWRLYFPWLSGRVRIVFRDLAGLLRGRLPSSEGGGLTSAVQGFTVLAFVLTATTGAGWLLANGADAALAWRSVHVLGADVLGVLIVVHAVTALLHVIQMARG